jgi:hypothetical protein
LNNIQHGFLDIRKLRKSKTLRKSNFAKSKTLLEKAKLLKERKIENVIIASLWRKEEKQEVRRNHWLVKETKLYSTREKKRKIWKLIKEVSKLILDHHHPLTQD